ncbi:MAG: alpha/beta hydrolase [Oscillospiraceae bacterium]|nr:alpha/beta hydrolase [Oscillospiraceae bacterium]
MRRWIAAAALAPLVAAGVFTGELYRHVFCRGGSPILTPLLDKKGHAEDYYLHRDSAAAALRRLPQERLEILSSRGKRLRGFYIPCGGNGRRIAFLVHGYRSEHAETAGMYLDYYRSRGFDLFCCDHEAHGESEGHLIGFASYEPEDCLRWIDLLRERFGPQVQILLHGFSMGAATVLRMAPRCPGNVRAIVEDSGFRSAEIQLKAQLGAMYGPLRLLHRALAGVDLRGADAMAALQEAELPILFVHGREDPSVPFANGPLLFESYTGPKACLFTERARHVETMHVAPAAYAEALDALIAGSFRPDAEAD